MKMTQINRAQIDDLEKIYRINLINSCSGFKSANLIATKSTTSIANVAVFSSVVHLGSNPPHLGFILRPTTVPRNTYENIKDTGFYTINHIYSDIIRDAHHTSAKYDRHISEFNMTSLTKEYKDDFYAPFVKNSPVQIAMKYVEEYYIISNNVIMVVGEIMNIYVDQDILEMDGFINLSEANVATINGLDAYALPKLKDRFTYQRPKSTSTA